MNASRPIAIDSFPRNAKGDAMGVCRIDAVRPRDGTEGA